MAGPVPVELFASTTGTDSDWVVKLIDVFPDDAKDPDPNPAGLRMGGYQMLLVGDLLRGKFRRELQSPVRDGARRGDARQFRSGRDRYHTFLKGHSIPLCRFRAHGFRCSTGIHRRSWISTTRSRRTDPGGHRARLSWRIDRLATALAGRGERRLFANRHCASRSALIHRAF